MERGTGTMNRREPQMKVLVVEDDASVARFLVRGLREEGYDVDICSDSESAALNIQRIEYDAIILDWMLPDGDGVSMLRGWRARGIDAAVLVLTARGGTDSIVVALDSGADDYLTKPFSFEELLARLRALGRRTTTRSAFALGGARVDLSARTITRGDQVESLSNREHALLKLLIEHRGEILGRMRILDAVWGVNNDPTTNVVDVYIRYLRTKLEGAGATSSSSIIETVRGKGYRLRAGEDQDHAPS